MWDIRLGSGNESIGEEYGELTVIEGTKVKQKTQIMPVFYKF